MDLQQARDLVRDQVDMNDPQAVEALRVIEQVTNDLIPTHPRSAGATSCPHCGSDNVHYFEFISQTRPISHLEEDGQVVFLAEADVNDEDGQGEQMLCKRCLSSWPLPNDIDFVFV